VRHGGRVVIDATRAFPVLLARVPASTGAAPGIVAKRVRSPGARRRAALAMVSFVASSAFAAGPAPTSSVVTLLERIQQAAQQQNYVGSYMHQQGAQVQASRVTHLQDKTGEFEKLELMDGQEREFIRHNDDVRVYSPDSRLLLIEKRARYDTFPALLTTTAADIDRFYLLRQGETDRVAGHAAQEVVLEARDKERYGYRLWYDRDTFLLLKAQTVGDHDNVIEQVAFSDVVIGGAIDPARVKPKAANTDGWRVETNRMIPVDLTQAGWIVTQPVPGFRKVMEVRRAFGGREDIGQMVYSDGLASISVFIEAHVPIDAKEGDAARGPVNIVMRRFRDYWLTVVGDAPVSAIRQMAQSIDLKPASSAK
jgi:sigma-E factor negative regulatory protein RseB